MMLAEFHFIRPLWLLALLPFIMLIGYLLKRSLISKQWENVCDPELLPHILIGSHSKKSYMAEIIIGVVGSMMIVALAGPTWERMPQPVYKQESALVIALDLSLSMLSEDVQPSRLERARFEISDLLDMRKEGQTALLVYAGDAFIVTPLTDDVRTIKSQLSALSPTIMPAPGSRTDLALSLATDLLSQAGMREGHILLVTDEIDGRYEKAIRAAKEKGARISILGIGTAEGAPIKLDNGSFLKAPDDSIVIPILQQGTLKELASVGDGIYQNSGINDKDVSRLQALFMSDIAGNEDAVTDMQSDSWYEFGPWLLLLILPVIAFGFRRGILCFLAGIIILHQDPAMAFDWEQLWFNDDQLALQALQQQQTEKAVKLFDDPKWKAAAQYRSGNYAETDALLKDIADVEAQYNRANALAKQGLYQEAIDTYDLVLEQRPNHEDARYNRELVKNEMDKQEQSETSQQSNDEQQQQESEQGEPQQQQGEQQEQEQDSNSQTEQQTESQQQQESEQVEPQQDSDSEQGEQGEQEIQEGEQPENEEQADKSMQQFEQEADEELDEDEQATEQWLRRIPDDPSGLLRRKFKYQYQQRQRQNNGEQYW